MKGICCTESGRQVNNIERGEGLMTPLEAIDKMAGQPVLVIGDMIADIYLYGTISRISREAPVLVLEQSRENVVAGGAANVVNNAATLGGRVFAAGLTGDDSAADGLAEILSRQQVDVSGFIRDASRPTIAKTRVVAGGRTTVSQQIVRIDRESREAMSQECEKRLSDYLAAVLPQVKGIVLSDYGSGTITDRLLQQIFDWSRPHGIPTIVDSRYDILRFKTVDYIKQNDAELAAVIGHELNTEDELVAGGCRLLRLMSAKGALITRGEDGMTLFQRLEDGSQAADVELEGLRVKVTNIPVTDKSEVYDVSGAGDTCVAAVILGLAAGIDPVLASQLSNEASSISVRKMGTSVVYADELRKKYC